MDNLRVRVKFEVSLYARYQDDTLIAMGGTSQSRRRFIEIMKFKQDVTKSLLES